MRRVALLIVASGVLAGCQTPPLAPPPAEPAPTKRREAESPPAPPQVPLPAVPVGLAAQQEAQKIVMSAVEMLEQGSEEPARAELKRALAVDPQNKLALSLTRQMTADPITALGRESFAYTVHPSDTMSRIAERFLGDRYSFYILARYNSIPVPKQLSAGQVLRIPGRAPPPGPPPAEPLPRTSSPQPAPAAPPPAPAATPARPPPPPPPPEPAPAERAMRSAAAAERAGDLQRARADYQSAANLGQPGAAEKAEQMRSQLVQRYSVAARTAFARQDLDGAIANWQRVLEIEPDNASARSEIERMRALKKKLGDLK